MDAPCHRPRITVRRVVSALVIAACVGTAISAGPLPNLLDDNRDNLALEALETAAFNLALTLAGFFANPLTFTYPPVIIDGRVLANPEIHNLYLDDDWEAHNPDAPTRAQLDAMTQELVNGGYFSEADQYGIGSATFTGSHQRDFLCAALEPIAGNAEFVQVLAWVTCMAGFNPFPVPGAFPPLTGVPKGNDNSLYVVYLPRSVEIIEGGCGSFAAYHFFAAVADIDIEIIFPVPRSQTIAFAVVQTACADAPRRKAIRDEIFRAATHEIIEAAQDPLVATGWINNSVVTEAEGDNFFEELAASFSAVELDLRVGEGADICDDDGDQLDPPASQHPTNPIPIPTSNPLLEGSFLVAPYGRMSTRPARRSCRRGR